MWPNQRVESQFGRVPQAGLGPLPSCPPSCRSDVYGLGGYLPMARRHTTTTAVLNWSMLFWITMLSMARPV